MSEEGSKAITGAMDNNWDNLLASIEGPYWLPWIGGDFADVPASKRILVIGESHYHNDTDESIAEAQMKGFTRLVVTELGIKQHYYDTKFFQNLHRAIFRTDQFDSRAFWDSVCFYNFIQRPMHTNKDRPTDGDFHSGWRVFFQLLEKFKFRTCLFIGTSASYSLQHAVAKSSFSMDKLRWGALINRAYPKNTILTSKEGKQTKLIFIRHTSSMFSWRRWNEHLIKVMPDDIEWLNKRIKT